MFDLGKELNLLFYFIIFISVMAIFAIPSGESVKTVKYKVNGKYYICPKGFDFNVCSIKVGHAVCNSGILIAVTRPPTRSAISAIRAEK